MKTISIIAPIYNEEKNIKNLYNELDIIASKHQNYKFKFILVNDGSRDKSHNEIIKINDDRIIYINFSRNFGKESAIIAGLDNSVKYDASVVIDSDLQMPFSYITEMISYWEEGFKLIVCKKKKRDTTKLKGYLSEKYYIVFSKLSKIDIVQNALDYVFMDNEVIKKIINYREHNRFFKGIIASIGYEKKIIEVEILDRVEGESSFSSFHELFSYAFVSIASFSKLPLYFAIVLGFVISLLSVFYGIIIIFQYIFFGNNVNGYSSVMTVLLFFGGVILLVLGIIGYYIGQIIDEVKNRPLYIVERCDGIDS